MSSVASRGINFRNLDALRGLLAVYVAIGHCRWLLWGGHAAWLASPFEPWETVPVYASAVFRYGREAVMVFFVLSGFFIHYQAAARLAVGPAPVKVATFYRRRWHRLAPPYFFALAVTIVCDSIGRQWWPTIYLAQTGDSLLDETFARGGYSGVSVIPALLVLPSSLARDFGSNGPLWSLAFEAVYYALYPAWWWLRRKSALAAFVGVPAGCVALAFLPVGAFPITVLMHYPIWLMGAFIAEQLVARGTTSVMAAIGLGLFAAGAMLHVVADTRLPVVIAAVMFGSGLVMFFASARARNPLLTAAEFLGVRSYTIYIVHFPLLALISAYAFQVHGGRPMHGWLAVSGALACVAFGCLCFEACERHFLHPRYRDESAAP